MAVLNNSNAISSGGYNLTNSLRFRGSASAYLNRTFGTPTNNKIFTWSAWIKLGTIPSSREGFLVGSSGAGSYFALEFNASAGLSLWDSNTSTSVAILVTTQVFRDPSAWYHIVLAVDTTQATAANRIKLYVNGSQVTALSTATYPAQNSNPYMNSSSSIHNICNWTGTSLYLDGYLAEINFIDGQALTPSSFGETSTTTGSWIPKAYSGTYGTNGFYLKFSDIATTSGSNAGLGKDFSGNTNYWTTNNISVTAGTTYDAMLDVPTNTSATVANYCVLSPLSGGLTPSQGNLAIVQGSAAWNTTGSTILPTTGKWYFEGFMGTIGGANYIGIGLRIAGQIAAAEYAGSIANSWGFIANSANYNTYTGGAATNAGSFTATTATAFQVAVDFDAGKMWFGFNNTWVASGNPSTGANATYTFTANTSLQPILSAYSNTNYINFGQRAFSYTPPTGFVALNTYNLPDSTIKKGNTVMDATLYTGTAATQSITNTASFKPDLVWLKIRSGSGQHVLTDSVRGVSKQLFSSLTNAETTEAGKGVTSFNSNGFTLGDELIITGSSNANGATYVGWQWQAGQGSSTSNTSGSITSTVSVNATAGFSVVTYTGTGANATVGHGLGVAPSWVIVKRRDTTGNWQVRHTSITAANSIQLNLTNASASATTVWNSTAPTSTVFSIGTSTDVNASTGTYLAYCWAEIAGFSKFGSYTGNGSADGPFVYLGFRPKFVLMKRTDTGTESWFIFDSSRKIFNPEDNWLAPNLSSAETTNTFADFLSNGFKVRVTTAGFNGSGGTFIYAAFAENPFKNALAR
jgi:hypothetical protein